MDEVVSLMLVTARHTCSVAQPMACCGSNPSAHLPCTVLAHVVTGMSLRSEWFQSELSQQRTSSSVS